MIGVIADPAEHGVVREFFELFKTPWEFYRRDRQYDVCSAPETPRSTLPQSLSSSTPAKTLSLTANKDPNRPPTETGLPSHASGEANPDLR
jgi:hypothetical protein